MSDLKISQLSDGGASQAADEYVVARSGANYRIDGASVAAAATSVGTLTSLTVSGSAGNIGSFTSSATTTALVLNNTHANAWGSNLAIQTGGTAAGYFGTIGSLLGNTTQDLAVYATAGNGFRVYTNGNNLRATFDTSGNLGLGVTPSAWGASYKALQVNNVGLMANAGTADGMWLMTNAYFDNSNYKYIASDYASMYTSVNGAHNWLTAASGTAGNNITFTQAMTLDASGGLQVLNAIGVGNTAPTTSGAGITFPATQSASTNANTLDDYEEGTFTPTYEGTTGSIGSTAYSGQSGVYTKVGNVVTANGTLILSNKGSWTGNVVIKGLPFTASSTSSQNMGAMWTESVTFADQINTRVGPSENYVVPRINTSGTGGEYLQTTGVVNTSGFRFSVTYIV